MLLQRFAFYLIKRPEGLIAAELFKQRLQGSRDGILNPIDLRNAQPLRGHSRYQFARLSRHIFQTYRAKTGLPQEIGLRYSIFDTASVLGDKIAARFK